MHLLQNIISHLPPPLTNVMRQKASLATFYDFLLKIVICLQTLLVCVTGMFSKMTRCPVSVIDFHLGILVYIIYI